MKLKKNKVDILGTQYTIIKDSVASNPKLINANAYVELHTHKIVYEESCPTLETLEKLDERNKKYIRHEVIHAFFQESGLRKYNDDEVLVEWLALQFGKIEKVFNELGIKEDK